MVRTRLNTQSAPGAAPAGRGKPGQPALRPAAVPPIGARWEARRAHARLAPLWEAVTAVAPEPVYGNGNRGTDDRLRVRITEIRDVLIGPLHSYLDPALVQRVTRRAAELGEPEHQAQAIGEAVAAAVEAKRRGLPPLDPRPSSSAEHPTTKKSPNSCASPPPWPALPS
ncbi:DUF6545 domain-containing protein [Saccharothrix australiensis]|uniref:DUF6545 domain-containing protein n=1 Tax=Saccharothrix australiensis TaxID=2072 RepID=UPI003CCC52D8